MKKRRFILWVTVLMTFRGMAATDPVVLKSPDGTLEMQVYTGDEITYDLKVDGKLVLSNCAVGIQLGREELGRHAVLKRMNRSVVDETIRPVVPLKQAVVRNYCNQLTMTFDRGLAIDFRVYDQGMAYRIRTSRKGMVEVTDERCRIGFADDYRAVVSPVDGFKSSCEEVYQTCATASMKADGRMTYLPILVDAAPTCKILISESDLRDYPGMFLRPTGSNALQAVFPPCPLEFGDDGDRSVTFARTAGYIARTKGSRSFPWRFFVVARDDRQLVESTMEMQLAGTCEIEDTSWIKPGQVSWDWWNHKMIWDVDFVSGINTETYKAYIDFASENKVPYVILDEGWARTTADTEQTIDDIDMPELIRYGKERGVGLILWLPWLTVENNMDCFAMYEKWGVAGLKIDFMDRQDQWMVNFYERVVSEAARHHLLIDFHGAYKPSGLEQRYPNLLSYEGVRGLEYNGGCEPRNSIWLPFMRNAVGAMDFTPGAMISSQPEHNRTTDPAPMGNGTRAYQMALYVVFESGIQMLSDSPSRYRREKECTDFIAAVPVTWDETRVLDAKAGEYVVVAKRKGNRWFIGAITNEHPRDLEIAMDYLDAGEWKMTCFRDGANAHRQAMDYVKEVKTVGVQSRLPIHLSRNGGWCAVVETVE